MAHVTEQAGDAPVVIRLGTAIDADAAARLHAGLITDGFLSRLGPRFLRHLYRCISGGPDCFLLVAVAGSDSGAGTATGPATAPIAGFLAGALDLRALYRRFALRRGLVAAVTSLPRLIRALPQVWETLRHGAGASGPDDNGAELLSIAVDPAWRGRHVGALLVEGFFDEIGRRGVDRSQVVVGADNTAAVGLYGRSGFVGVRTFELHRGVTSLLMRRPG